VYFSNLDLAVEILRQSLQLPPDSKFHLPSYFDF